jgi:hypothetical protein
MLIGYTHLPIYSIRGKITGLYCYGTNEAALHSTVRVRTTRLDQWIIDEIEWCSYANIHERLMYHMNKVAHDPKCLH